MMRKNIGFFFRGHGEKIIIFGGDAGRGDGLWTDIQQTPECG
jgi:hypothetical protein